MELIPIELISEDMVLGKTIYTNNGQTLLVEGAALKKSYREGLKKFGIHKIYVEVKKEQENNCVILKK